ncbi:hypothetical protein C8J56DRAFT_958451 [Mycena floridula]|nr:hypothetical protein C8J56DRAFT_958451 [Mycena floridula]
MQGLVEQSFLFISRHVESGTAAPWIIAALKTGLLTAFIDLHSYIKFEDVETTATNILEHVIPKYLAERAVVKAAKQALDSIRAQSKHSSVLNGFALGNSWAGRAWTSYEELVTERDSQSDGVFFDAAFCGNKTCGKGGTEKDFKTCGSCQVTLFCDKACLAAAWKDGHKEKCRLIRERNPERRGRRNMFMRFLTIHIMVQNLAAMRKEALEKFPNVSPTELMVRVDFTKTPRPEITVCRTSEYWKIAGGTPDDILSKHSERHRMVDMAEIRAHPERQTITWGIFASGEGRVQDSPIFSAGHWILDKHFNGRSPNLTNLRG